jgi:ribosomal protein L33
VEVRTSGGAPKLQLKKYCPRTRTHTEHKIKRK